MNNSYTENSYTSRDRGTNSSLLWPITFPSRHWSLLVRSRTTSKLCEEVEIVRRVWLILTEVLSSSQWHRHITSSLAIWSSRLVRSTPLDSLKTSTITRSRVSDVMLSAAGAGRSLSLMIVSILWMSPERQSHCDTLISLSSDGVLCKQTNIVTVRDWAWIDKVNFQYYSWLWFGLCCLSGQTNDTEYSPKISMKYY